MTANRTTLSWPRRVIDAVTDGSGIIAGVVCGVLVFLLCFEVVMRYIFNRPTSWSVEVSQYALLLITFLGAAYTLKEDGHINVDVFIVRLPERPRTYLRILTTFLSLVFCGLLTYHGWVLAYTSLTGKWTWEVWRVVPIYPVYMLVPFGGALLCLQCLLKMWSDIRLLREGVIVPQQKSE